MALATFTDTEGKVHHINQAQIIEIVETGKTDSDNPENAIVTIQTMKYKITTSIMKSQLTIKLREIGQQTARR